MRFTNISYFVVCALVFGLGCGGTKVDSRDGECEDSQCVFPPQSGCSENIAITFEEVGRCERNECVYSEIETSCSDGTVCRGGICVIEEDLCNDVVCDDPPESVCNASDVVTYPEVGECQDGQCIYQATYTPCGEGEVCMNARCYDANDPCANMTCNTPPPPGCEGNNALVYEAEGVCTDGECIYPVMETECGDDATCINGECDDSINPCDGIECITPPERTCAGNTVIIYDDVGVCQQGECKYSAVEEICAVDEICSGGMCVDPCIEVICDSPPVNTCVGNDLYTYASVGNCSLGECSYSETITPCGVDKICYEASCKHIPLEGDLMVTEIMYDPTGADTGYEWFELHNPREYSIYLGGLTITDSPSSAGTFNQLSLPVGTEIEAGAYVVFGQSSDAVAGIDVIDYSSFGDLVLANNDDELILTYNGLIVERVEYNENDGFPEAKGVSLSLDPSIDAPGNDNGSAWCFGLDAYDAAAGTDSPKGHGTPGQPNPPCDFMCFDVECETPSDSCSSNTIALQFSGPGVCDSATGECSNDDVASEIDCVAANGGDTNYICEAGNCVDGCEGVFCDEAPPSVCSGNAVVAYVELGSCVAGNCQHAALDPVACASDETCVETAESAQCQGDPCEGVTCEQPSTQCDGNTVVTYTGPGICVAGTCDFSGSESRTDCDNNEACFNGSCMRSPEAEDLLITEYLANPAGVDDGREWFEVYNTHNEDIYLGGLVVKDLGTNSFVVSPGVFIAGASYFVFAASSGATVPEPDFSWPSGSFQLGNDEDEIVLEYDGEVIDSVAYDDCANCFPDENGASVSLEPSLFGLDNSLASHWCLGTNNFGVGDSLGSPGVANHACFSCTDGALCPNLANECLDSVTVLQYAAASCVNDECDYSASGQPVGCGAQICLNGECVDPPS